MHILGVQVPIGEYTISHDKLNGSVVLQSGQSLMLTAFELNSKRRSMQISLNVRGLVRNKAGVRSIKFFYAYGWEEVHSDRDHALEEVGELPWPPASYTIMPSYAYIHSYTPTRSPIAVNRLPQIFIFLKVLFNGTPIFESILNVHRLLNELALKSGDYKIFEGYESAIDYAVCVNPTVFANKRIIAKKKIYEPTHCRGLSYRTPRYYDNLVDKLDRVIGEKKQIIRLRVYTDYGSVDSYISKIEKNHRESGSTIVPIIIWKKDQIKTMVRGVISLDFLYAPHVLSFVVLVQHIEKMIEDRFIDPGRKFKRPWLNKIGIEKKHKAQSRIINVTPILISYDYYKKRLVKYFAVILVIKPLSNVKFGGKITAILYFCGNIDETHNYWSLISVERLKEILFDSVIKKSIVGIYDGCVSYAVCCLYEIDKNGTAHSVLASVLNSDDE